MHNFPRGSWQAGKVEEVQPGFDSANVESYLLTKYGPGTYRFSAIVGQRTFAWRVYKLGDVPDPANGGNGHAIDPNAVTPDEALRQVVSHLRTNLTSSQLSGMVADLESARANRELAPMKHMTDLIAAVIGKIGAPAPPGNDRIVDLLIAELKEARQDMREIRAAAAAGAAAPTAGASSGAARLAEDIRAVLAAGELLGMKRGGSSPAPSIWTPETVKNAIDAAAPLLNRVGDLIQLKFAPGAPLPAAAAAPGPRALTEGTVTMDPQVKEQVDFFLEALRTRDFSTVQWCLENLFVGPTGEPLVTIDPTVNPLAYVLKMKPFAPKIDELRAEVGEFLKWVGEHKAAAAAGAA